MAAAVTIQPTNPENLHDRLATGTIAEALVQFILHCVYIKSPRQVDVRPILFSCSD